MSAFSGNQKQENPFMITKLPMTLIVLVVLLLVSCTGLTTRHGYAPTLEELEGIEVGVSTQRDVFGLIGTPTHVDQEYGTTWIYVENQIYYEGLRPPEVTERNVVLILYGDGVIVRNIETYGMEDGVPVQLTQRITETYKGRLTLVQQIMRSFGQITPDLIAPNLRNNQEQF